MKFKLFCFVLGLSLPSLVFSQESVFSKIDIIPNADQPDKFTREFIGNGQRISVLFKNDTQGPEQSIDVFPEPPLRLRDKQNNSACEISDGGIWSRDQVYLSNDEHYLLVSEYSGSSGWLVSYDTRTCEPFQRLDISNLKWTIEGNILHIEPFNLNFFALPVN